MTDTELGNRIQGFLKKMADHGMEVVTQREGGQVTGYSVFGWHLGTKEYIASVTGPDGLESLIRSWDRDGWPISDGGMGEGKTTVASPNQAIKDEDTVPPWVSPLVVSGRVTVTGDGDYTTLPQQSLTAAIRHILPSFGNASFTIQTMLESLVKEFPAARFNYKSVSAGVTPLRLQGELTRIRKGLYRWTGKPSSPKSRSAAARSAATTKRASSGLQKVGSSDQTLLDLLSLGTEWRAVGRSADGSLIYTVGDGGSLYRVSVGFERL